MEGSFPAVCHCSLASACPGLASIWDKLPDLGWQTTASPLQAGLGYQIGIWGTILCLLLRRLPQLNDAGISPIAALTGIECAGVLRALAYLSNGDGLPER